MNNDNKRDFILSPAFEEAAKIRQKKSDYGDIKSYFPFKSQSYCHEISKKSNRLINLVRLELTPNNESIEDNLLDLINYASYYWEYLQELKK